MYGGRVRFESPMLWSVAFMVTFVIGGMTGVLMAVPPADFVLHNSLFLVAHFHNVIIGGVLFGCFAGYAYWFPKAFGFRLDETWGKRAFWLWFTGFYTAFMPLYVLGLLGMTRRMQHFDRPEWYPWVLLAGVGALLITLGICAQVMQLAVSIRHRALLRDTTGDPWDGRTLEWATASPPPAFNFAVLPNVQGEEPYWGMKQRARQIAHLLTVNPAYTSIMVPRNSPTGVVTAFFATLIGFAMIWRIYWLAGLAFVGVYAVFVVFAWRDRSEERISAAEVARIDQANRLVRSAALAEGH
jgi:cytochrome o ubiquinol oxidase subunit 1